MRELDFGFEIQALHPDFSGPWSELKGLMNEGPSDLRRFRKSLRPNTRSLYEPPKFARRSNVVAIRAASRSYSNRSKFVFIQGNRDFRLPSHQRKSE